MLCYAMCTFVDIFCVFVYNFCQKEQLRIDVLTTHAICFKIDSS